MQENLFELQETVKKEEKKESWDLKMQKSWAVDVGETEKEEQGSRRSNTV